MAVPGLPADGSTRSARDLAVPGLAGMARVATSAPDGGARSGRDGRAARSGAVCGDVAAVSSPGDSVCERPSGPCGASSRRPSGIAEPPLSVSLRLRAVAVSGPEFKGFLLEARDAEDPGGAPVGSFTLIDKEVSQLLACGGKEVCVWPETDVCLFPRAFPSRVARAR